MTLPGSVELQLTLPVPTKPGAVGPRNSTMFRKLAVQRLGLERNITVHSVLGLQGMILLGQLSEGSLGTVALSRFHSVSIPMVLTCKNCGANGQEVNKRCLFCHSLVGPNAYSSN